ncbi:hypothetical protein AQS8620_01179 [Aquimixticola soesokkakensis]|uniref:Integral membrane protein (DUF2244) n=1 Tax=Aquimixticola soesokkakensis TaxID=1519096 RepID=A0A1Y5S8N5_9RHOB|nr:DUF2244 domain-containing protein [Aquimixticola soesokkakensis]SLN34992.1 hypothetical protein AQS8620_01179 [Aquimixticola soesokkakensis]
MPYRWTPDHSHTPTQGAPLRLDLWPHRSLSPRGFSWVIGVAFGLALVPLVPFIGTSAFWVILPLMMASIAALWIAIRASDRDHLREVMTITPQQITLIHTDANRREHRWNATPYWVRITLHRGNKPVEAYLTLKGEGRTVELGAFLSPDERRALRDDLAYVLGRIT